MTAGIDYMPTLSHGSHGTNSGKACVMEYVSVLAGERWSDHPDCVHPWIASVARSLNDNLYDGDRHLLIPLIPRLLNANTHDPALAKRVEQAMRDFVMTQRPTMWPSPIMKMMLSTDKTFNAAFMGFVATSPTSEEQTKYLLGLLDAFDAGMGRPMPVEVPNYETRLTRAVAQVENRPLPTTKVTGFRMWVAEKAPIWFKSGVEPVKPVCDLSVHYDEVEYEDFFIPVKIK